MVVVVVAVTVAVVTIVGCRAVLLLFGVEMVVVASIALVVEALETSSSHCGGCGCGRHCVGCVVALRLLSQSWLSSLPLVGGVVLALIP